VFGHNTSAPAVGHLQPNRSLSDNKKRKKEKKKWAICDQTDACQIIQSEKKNKALLSLTPRLSVLKSV
jgi:hypothetical protein